MKISDQFPSKYLRASDFESETTVAIARVNIEEVGATQDRLPVLYLQGYDKGVVLNRTNSNTIAGLYGDDTDDWEGEAITLFTAMVSFQGETKPAIRMKAPRRKDVAKAKAAPAKPADDSEIPF